MGTMIEIAIKFVVFFIAVAFTWLAAFTAFGPIFYDYPIAGGILFYVVFPGAVLYLGWKLLIDKRE